MMIDVGEHREGVYTARERATSHPSEKEQNNASSTSTPTSTPTSVASTTTHQLCSKHFPTFAFHLSSFASCSFSISLHGVYFTLSSSPEQYLVTWSLPLTNRNSSVSISRLLNRSLPNQTIQFRLRASRFPTANCQLPRAKEKGD
jgi:hypothetical protein